MSAEARPRRRVVIRGEKCTSMEIVMKFVRSVSEWERALTLTQCQCLYLERSQRPLDAAYVEVNTLDQHP